MEQWTHPRCRRYLCLWLASWCFWYLIHSCLASPSQPKDSWLLLRQVRFWNLLISHDEWPWRHQKLELCLLAWAYRQDRSRAQLAPILVADLLVHSLASLGWWLSESPCTRSIHILHSKDCHSGLWLGTRLSLHLVCLDLRRVAPSCTCHRSAWCVPSWFVRNSERMSRSLASPWTSWWRYLRLARTGSQGWLSDLWVWHNSCQSFPQNSRNMFIFSLGNGCQSFVLPASPSSIYHRPLEVLSQSGWASPRRFWLPQVVSWQWRHSIRGWIPALRRCWRWIAVLSQPCFWFFSGSLGDSWIHLLLPTFRIFLGQHSGLHSLHLMSYWFGRPYGYVLH